MTEETKHKISEKLKGRKLSEETKKKLSDSKKEQIVTDDTKEKMSEAKKGNKYHKDKHHSNESKQKMSESMKGKTSWNKGHPTSEETKKKISDAKKGKPLSDETKEKISNANKGKSKFTEEQKLKMRESAIKRIEELGLEPSIGKHETQILDKLESLSGYKIERQYYVIGYFIDGYIPEIKLALEVDEEYHENKNQIERDIKREDNIKQELGCEFVRIKDSEFVETEIADILKILISKLSNKYITEL